MLHECLFHFQKNKNAQSPSVPLPVRSRDIRNRAAASKLARLIDPVVNLTGDWLICQPDKPHFLTEPNSHFTGCSRNPIHSSAGKNTHRPVFRQPPFLKFFHFFKNTPFLLVKIHIFPLPRDAIFAAPPICRRIFPHPRPHAACVCRLSAYAFPHVHARRAAAPTKGCTPCRHCLFS